MPKTTKQSTKPATSPAAKPTRPTKKPIDPALRQDSFAATERTEERLHDVKQENLAAVNRSAISVVTTVIAALPALRAQRPLFQKHLKTFDLALFDGLEDAANTLRVTQAALTAAKPAPDELAPLFAEAVAFRDIARQRRHEAREARRAPQQRARGAQRPWPLQRCRVGFAGHGQPPPHQLDRGVEEGLAGGSGQSPDHERPPFFTSPRSATRQTSPLTEATLRRAQAYTLVVRSYEYIRAALTWIHVIEGKGPITEIAPSLAVAKRGKGTEEIVTPAKDGDGDGDGGAPSPGGGPIIIPQDASHPRTDVIAPREDLSLGDLANPITG